MAKGPPPPPPKKSGAKTNLVRRGRIAEDSGQKAKAAPKRSPRRKNDEVCYHAGDNGSRSKEKPCCRKRMFPNTDNRFSFRMMVLA
jgi:hypothetical protein